MHAYVRQNIIPKSSCVLLSEQNVPVSQQQNSVMPESHLGQWSGYQIFLCWSGNKSSLPPFDQVMVSSHMKS